MSKRDIKLYFSDIIHSIRKIEKYTQNLSFNDFSKNSLIIDAVVRNLSIIGEAVNNIPIDIRIKYPEIPWTEIIGMRNKIIHEYFGVDEMILWQTINKDLPLFKKQLLQHRKRFKGN